MTTAIVVEDISKAYRLGQISGGTLAEDLNRWWAKMRGRPDPYLKLAQIDQNNHGNYIWALKNISFTVNQGEALGIIGRNGAGKSTLLKILSRITTPTCGQIKIKGRVASLLEVGTGFHPDLTGRENVFLNGAILGMNKYEVRRKFDEIVDFAGLGKFIETPVKRYSSGMYVRLAFAVAAHLDPEILVVDEVLAVGDIEFQKKCLGKMGEVAHSGRTVLFVSHNMGAINSLTRTSLWLNDGFLQSQGDSYSIVQSYIGHFDTISTGKVDLSDKAKFLTSVSLLQQGQPVNSIRMGEPLTIEVKFRSDRQITKPGVGIGIDHPQIGRVLSLGTRLAEYRNAPDHSTGGDFICEIDQLPLNQGNYTFVIVLTEGLVDLERVENACKLQIVPNDVFGTGSILAASQGVIYKNHSWRYENRN